MTHTYAELEISAAAYAEIAAKLRATGYDHAFDGTTIDMHGVALVPAPARVGPVEMKINEHGQKFFKYPESVQAFDVCRDLVATSVDGREELIPSRPPARPLDRDEGRFRRFSNGPGED